MMIKKSITGLFLMSLAATGALLAQQEVLLKISEGMPMVSVALPPFTVRSA